MGPNLFFWIFSLGNQEITLFWGLAYLWTQQIGLGHGHITDANCCFLKPAAQNLARSRCSMTVCRMLAEASIPKSRFLRLTCTSNHLLVEHLPQLFSSETASLRRGQNILLCVDVDGAGGRTILPVGSLCPLYRPGWVDGGWWEWNLSLHVLYFLVIVWHRQGGPYPEWGGDSVMYLLCQFAKVREVSTSRYLRASLGPSLSPAPHSFNSLIKESDVMVKGS